MIKTITVCDKCGKEILENGSQMYGYDLCSKCTEEVEKLVTGWIKPVYKKGTPKKWDKKKAQSLRNAGWRLDDIAKECGVTESTVCKHTVPPQPKKAKPNEWAQSEPDLPKALTS